MYIYIYIINYTYILYISIYDIFIYIIYYSSYNNCNIPVMCYTKHFYVMS